MAEKKKFTLPHVYILLLGVALLVFILNFIVPSGEYARVVVDGRSLVDPHSFTLIDKPSLSLLDYFINIHKGIAGTVDIIVMLLFTAASLGIVEECGAIAAAIHAILNIFKGKDTLVLIMFTALFSLLGTIGFAEGGTPFIPLAVSVGLALGYDRMTGAAAGILGLAVGFTSGVVNVYTAGTSQAILGLPLYSGSGFRIVCWFVFTTIACIYVVMYSKKIKKDPTKSIMGEVYLKELEERKSGAEAEIVPFTTQRKIVILAMFCVFGLQVFGTMKLGWYLQQLSAIYIILGIFAGLVSGYTPDQICGLFAKGASNILPSALCIGLARVTYVVMDQGKILDTAIHGIAEFLQGKSSIAIVLLLYLIVTIFNFFVVSGSGKAVILMPILGPLGQLIGINQQVIVVTYQFGDGFTNYFWPTAGTIMASLAFAKLSYEQWFKFSYKIFGVLFIAGGVMCAIAQIINLGPM